MFKLAGTFSLFFCIMNVCPGQNVLVVLRMYNTVVASGACNWWNDKTGGEYIFNTATHVANIWLGSAINQVAADATVSQTSNSSSVCLYCLLTCHFWRWVWCWKIMISLICFLKSCFTFFVICIYGIYAASCWALKELAFSKIFDFVFVKDGQPFCNR